MRQVELGKDGMRASVLGFGCSAVMGRVGRKSSLKALGAAYASGITFFDTARSYGYGESEALLGEFLQGRRQSVVISTKFGISPIPQSRLKNAAKPLARKVLSLLPSARQALQHKIGSQFIKSQFTVPLLRQSVTESLRKLRTDYIDMLFMHSPPVGALEQDDLFDAMRQFVVEGKVRRIGISADAVVIEAAVATRADDLRTLQFPCNLFNMTAPRDFMHLSEDIVAVANHPFGGIQGIRACKAALTNLAVDNETPVVLRGKLAEDADSALADAVLNQS